MSKTVAEYPELNDVMDTLQMPEKARALIVEVEEVLGSEKAAEFLLDAVHDVEREMGDKKEKEEYR
jgi:spore cortex formation protein SpoVR/YcgB (stage V sporulation)